MFAFKVNCMPLFLLAKTLVATVVKHENKGKLRETETAKLKIWIPEYKLTEYLKLRSL